MVCEIIRNELPHRHASLIVHLFEVNLLHRSFFALNEKHQHVVVLLHRGSLIPNFGGLVHHQPAHVHHIVYEQGHNKTSCITLDHRKLPESHERPKHRGHNLRVMQTRNGSAQLSRGEIVEIHFVALLVSLADIHRSLRQSSSFGLELGAILNLHHVGTGHPTQYRIQSVRKSTVPTDMHSRRISQS